MTIMVSRLEDGNGFKLAVNGGGRLREEVGGLFLLVGKVELVS